MTKRYSGGWFTDVPGELSWLGWKLRMAWAHLADFCTATVSRLRR